MSGNVTFQEYCANPSQYTTQLPLSIRQYWDSICQLQSSVSRNNDDSAGQLWAKTRGIGKFALNFMKGMIEGIFTPQGLEMLSIFMGVDLLAKNTLNIMLMQIKNAATDETAEAIAEGIAKIAVEKGVSEQSLSLTNAVLLKVLGDALEEGTAEAMAVAIADALSTAASMVMVIFTIVQILGAILDTWDPEGYNQMLDSDMLSSITGMFNTQFQVAVMSAVTTTQTEYGSDVIFNTWPVEFYADQMVLNVDGSYDDKYWANRRLELVFDYIYSLKFNSEGYEIIWPEGPDMTVNQSDFQKLTNAVDMMLSDGNAVVANWISRWWIIILIVVVLVLVFLILLK